MFIILCDCNVFVVLKWILLGGPIVLTLPHMLGTDDVYRTVIGQNPDIDKHLIFADIEPVCSFQNFFVFILPNFNNLCQFFCLTFVCRILDIP